MTRWQHTKDSDENADFMRTLRTMQLFYKAVIKYLNRSQLHWQHVTASINLMAHEEPTYSPIFLDGMIQFADQALLDKCSEILLRHKKYFFSDQVMAKVEIDIDRSEPLCSFGHSIDYLAPLSGM